MAKKKMTTEECLAEVNDGIREGLRFWSDMMLRAEADEWAYKLNYFPTDLMNAVYIFQHVASNIGIKAGKIDEETAKVLGNQLRKLVIDMTGYDPHGILDDLKKDKTTN